MDKLEEFVRNLMSNSPSFSIKMDMDENCSCGDSCECTPENDSCGCNDETTKKTVYYGLDIKVGPDGKPVVKEWGNIPSPFDGFNGGMPSFGATMKPKEKSEVKPSKAVIDFIDNPSEGKGKIIAELPGVSKDDIKVTVRNRTLYIQAINGDKMYKEEQHLPSIEEDTLKAKYTNGILEITFEYDHKIKSTSVKIE